MPNLISFKQRVATTVCQHSAIFKSVFIDYEYLVCSPAFVQNPYYIVTAYADNFLHLTGNAYRNPQEFFDKCYNGTLTETDISFTRRGQTENMVKGSIRRKIKVLPNLVNIFNNPLKAEESFSKNRVVCSFATSDNACTVGFTLTSHDSFRVRPMTLLSGFELNPEKSHDVELILRRKAGDKCFDTIVFGNPCMLTKYKESIFDLLSNQLKQLALTK